MTLMPNNIRTIKDKSEFQLKVKGSLFIASANPVKNEDETSTLINSQKKIHYDASHHCYGYKFADGLFKYSDAGEPSGTAGIRIMNAINHFNLSNVIVIVTRYFGGTKLGVPVLINAYRTASSEAIKNGFVIEKTVNQIFEIVFEYVDMNDVMTVLKEEQLEQFNQNFELTCSLRVKIRLNDAEKLKSRIEKIETVKVKNIGIE